MIDNFDCSHEISNQFVLALGLGVSDNEYASNLLISY